MLNIIDGKVKNKPAVTRKALQKAVSRLKIDYHVFLHQEIKEQLSRDPLAYKNTRHSLDGRIFSALDQGIKNLTTNIRHLSSLASLEFSFTSDFKTTAERFRKLFLTLKHHSHLSCLSLSFQGCFYIDDTYIDSLQYGFKYLVNLSHLNIRLKGSNHITDTGLKILASMIGKIAPLKSFSLILQSNTRITNKSLQSIFSTFKHLTSLASISLDLHSCREDNNQGIKDLACQLKHASLTSLEISILKLFNRSDEGVKSLILELQSFVHLATLKITIPLIVISTEVWNILALNLKHLIKLKVLKLHASMNALHYSEQILDILFSSPQNLTLLSTLDVKLIDYKVYTKLQANLIDPLGIIFACPIVT